MTLLGFLRRGRKDIDVAVVGAGLPALVAALELARRSRKVWVLGLAAAEEQATGLGLVALGPARPYAQVVDSLGRDAARSVWSSGRENVRLLRGFLEKARRDCGYDPRGSFLLASTRAEAEWLARSEDMLRDDEFPGEFLDHYMLETHFDVSGFAGAYWAAHGGELDAARLGAAVAAAAHASGAVFVPAPVRGLEAGRSGAVVETAEGAVHAASLVVATDAAVSGLLPGLGRFLGPAAPGRLRRAPEEGALLPTAARTADGRVAWQLRGGHLTLAATGPAASGGAPEEDSGVEALAARLPLCVVGARRWEERGEVAADGLPVVGPIGGGPLAVACGFGPLAVSLAFAAAGWVADALLTGSDPTPEAFRAGRDASAPGPV